VALLLVANLAAIAETYPTRIVTIVAPSAPGGLYSLFARIIGNRLEQRLGQSFVVENRPAAASVAGAVVVARAAPAGYTLMIASGGTKAVHDMRDQQQSRAAAPAFVPIRP